jgi:exonuclease SbcC
VIIRRVELRNILSHENTTVEFPDGVVAIIGPNGAGKSSIVDSIYMALFMGAQPDVRGGKKEHIITRGASSGEIRVEVEIDGKRYLAIRRLHVSNPAEAALYAVEGDSKRLRATSIDGVVSEISRLLGLGGLSGSELRKLAKSTIIALQGELTKIVDIGDAERREYILSLLGLGYLERALDALKEVTRERRELEGAWKAKYEYLGKLKSTIEKLRGERESLQRQVAEIEKRVAELERSTSELESRVKLVDEYLTTVQRLEVALAARRIRELEERVEELREVEEWWRSESGELKRLLREVERLRGDVARLSAEVSESLREISAALGVELSAPSDAERAVRELRSRLEELEAYRSLYEVYTEKFKATGACPLCGSRIENPEAFREHLETRLRELEEAARSLREKISSAESRLSALSERVARLQALREQLDREASELSRLVGRALALCEKHGITGDLEKCAERLTRLGEECSKLRAELDSLRKLYANTTVVESPEELLKRLEGVSALGVQAPGPDIESARRVAGELTRLRGELAREHEKKSRELGELRAKLERLRGQLDSASRQLEEYEAEVKRLERELAQLKKRVEAYELVEKFAEKYLGKSGVIARELTRVARAELERKANSILSRLMLRGISIGEGFELYVKHAGGLLPIDNASGGERVAIAIALRLALAELAMGRSPTVLILDEPTVHLDEERRSQIFTIIGELGKSLRQVIVVTHDEKVVDIADTVIRVENVGDTSRVTVEKTAT